MPRMVKCVKLGREAEGLDFPPYPGALGQRIFESVSKEAWKQWLEQQKMLVNENRLNLADNRAAPLLERLRFLCIVSSNLDEFFEIRVSGLQAEIEAGTAVIGPDHMDAQLVFKQVAQEAHELVATQYQLLNDEILPGLAAEGIRFLRRSD